MKYTNKELELAFYLLLDEQLHHIECQKIIKEVKFECDRCDTCMKEQYIKRIKNGETPRIIKECKNFKL